MKKITGLPVLVESFKQQLSHSRLKKEGHDIVLDPYIYSGLVSNSNWAGNYLQVNDYKASQPIIKRKAVVFIVDTAGAITHKDVLPYCNNDLGRDFTGEGVADGNGHGTACASCYVGKSNGVGPREEITIIPLKALRNNGSGSYSSVLQAVNYAYDTYSHFFKATHLGIISMSLGGGGSYKPLSDLMASIKKSGMWIGASSGNSGYSETINRVGFPAKDPSAWAIGAMDSAGRIASFSSAGKEVVLTGPGRTVQVAWKNDSYINANGTSFGMPYAMAALTWLGCQYPQLDNMDKAENFFKKHAKDLHTPGRDYGTGYGVPVLPPFIGQIPDDKPTETPPPPPPPPEEEEPPKEEPNKPPRKNDRLLQLPYKSNKWRMTWQEQGKTDKHALYITSIDIEYQTKELVPTVFDNIEKGLNWFFTGRGLILSIDNATKTKNQLAQLYKFSDEMTHRYPWLIFLPYMDATESKDFHDATIWTARFIEVMLKKDKGLPVKVRHITGKDEKGRTVNIKF